ncbi:MAG: hypothetical protein M1820_009924 [Bogoriella megaspora]|nr:MAG: hypothetical protein M1820_009924 [Bogoriella megaspora]
MVMDKNFTILLPLAFLAVTISALTIPGYGLKLSPTGKHFSTQDGKPFFWQADTSWALFHRLTLNETEAYLEDRASKGYTMILAVAFTQFGTSSPNREGDLPFVDLNPTLLNEPYWQKVDTVVEMAWDRNIRIAMIPAWGQYIHGSDNSPGSINATNAMKLGQLIGSRYPGLPKILVADTNPWWLNKTEVKADYASGGVHRNYSFTDWLPIYDDLAEGLVAGETNSSQGVDPMITIHCTNQWFEEGPIALASTQTGYRSWLTFDSSQSGHADFPPNPPIPWWNARRGYEPVELMYQGLQRLPLVDNEAHYEGRYDNGNSSLRVWNATDVLSGASGLTYGHDMVMQGYIPEAYTTDGSGPAVAFFNAIKAPGAGQMQYIRKVIEDRSSDFFSRIPAQDVLVGDTGVNDQHVVAARDSGGEYIIVYTPTGKTFSVNTTSLGSKDIRANWYDPTSGVYTSFSFPAGSGSSINAFTPPSNATHVDWVLVLEMFQ